jgi:hypothetical protein
MPARAARWTTASLSATAAMTAERSAVDARISSWGTPAR